MAKRTTQKEDLARRALNCIVFAGDAPGAPEDIRSKVYAWVKEMHTTHRRELKDMQKRCAAAIDCGCDIWLDRNGDIGGDRCVADMRGGPCLRIRANKILNLPLRGKPDNPS